MSANPSPWSWRVAPSAPVRRFLGSLGADASSLAGSERASRDATLGGAPSLDLTAAARLVSLLGELSRDRVLAAAHDVSIGGIAVAAARMAIAAGVGAQLSVARREPLPTAAWFGERAGRVLVAAADHAGAQLSAAAADAEVVRYMSWPRHRSIQDTYEFLRFSDAQWAHWSTGGLLAFSRADGLA